MIPLRRDFSVNFVIPDEVQKNLVVAQ